MHLTVKLQKSSLLALAALLWAAGCSPPFSKAALERVDRAVPFEELKRDPDRYKGTWVMLAGVIIDARNAQDGTYLEVLQTEMDRRGRPVDIDASKGRFLIASDRFLDAAVYHAGRSVTVIGEVAGQKVQPLGEVQYRYPVVLARELNLWEPVAGPQFFFGVGVSHRL